MRMLIQLPYEHGEDSLYMYYEYEKVKQWRKNIMNQTWREPNMATTGYNCTTNMKK